MVVRSAGLKASIRAEGASELRHRTQEGNTRGEPEFRDGLVEDQHSRPGLLFVVHLGSERPVTEAC
jgi:hypothetical protein